MTRRGVSAVGFDRRIDLEWLDVVAGRLADGDSAEAARSVLDSVLAQTIKSTAYRGAREKTATVVARVWILVPATAAPVRDFAVGKFLAATGRERLAIHWGLCAAAYPFFVDVASAVGGLLALFGSCSLAQVRRRVIEKWGERSTLNRATQRVLRSMVQWGALRDGTRRGEYVPAATRIPVDDGPALVLVEGVLAARGGRQQLAHLLADPAVFPFQLKVGTATLRSNPRIDLYRDGDRADYVELRRAREGDAREATGPSRSRREEGGEG